MVVQKLFYRSSKVVKSSLVVVKGLLVGFSVMLFTIEQLYRYLNFVMDSTPLTMTSLFGFGFYALPEYLTTSPCGYSSLKEGGELGVLLFFYRWFSKVVFQKFIGMAFLRGGKLKAAVGKGLGFSKVHLWL